MSKIKTLKEFERMETIQPGQYLRPYQVERSVSRGAPHYFSAGAKRFFSSRLLDHSFYAKGKVWFITSEQFRDHRGHSEPRKYTVRAYDVRSTLMENVEDFQAFGTVYQAKKALIAAAGLKGVKV